MLATCRATRTRSKTRLNFDNTMGPVAGPLRALSASLRQQASAEHFIGSVATPRMPQPDCVGGASRPSPMVAAAAVAAAAGGVESTSASGVGAGGSLGDEGDGVPQTGGGEGRKRANTFRACTECGHHKGAWPQHHPGNRSGDRSGGVRCSMPENQRRKDSEKAFSAAQRKKAFTPCECFVCMGSYKR